MMISFCFGFLGGEGGEGSIFLTFLKSCEENPGCITWVRLE